MDALPWKLSQETLENILIAVSQAKDERGLFVNLPPELALSPALLEQMPDFVRQQYRMCGSAG